SRRWGVDFEARYQILRWLFADYDLNWAQARFSNGGYVPLAVPLFMNGGLPAALANNFTVGLPARAISDRPAHAHGTQTAQGYYLVDLIGRYRWRNVETLVQLLNVTNTDWREAQFADNSCVRSQEQTGHPGRACYDRPGMDPVTPPSAIHFTPGNPI